MNMDDATDLDSLSDLPLSLIETILTLLPIRDAVKTSVLSSEWRYKWASIPELIFCDNCVNFSPDRDTILELEGKLINLINHALLLHQGPIHKFKICSLVPQGHPVVDQWLLFLSRKDLRELILEWGTGKLVRAPSCLFSFQYLTHLELNQYEFHPPTSFKGFAYLKTLILKEGSMAAEAVGSLISKSPLLESLTLTLNHCDGWNLNIYGPNLKYLYLEVELKKLCLEETPLVETMIVSLLADPDKLNPDEFQEHLEQSLGCNYIKFLSAVPNLRFLSGLEYFTKYLSIGIDKWRPQVTHRHLKTIEFKEVNFEDISEILVVIRLITNSPNLQRFFVSFCDEELGSPKRVPAVEASVMEVWKSGCSSDYTLKRLKTVIMKQLSGAPHEMEFIRFLLGNSPVLAQMCIIDPWVIEEEEVYVSMELLRFRRASPLAGVFFIPKILDPRVRFEDDLNANGVEKN